MLCLPDDRTDTTVDASEVAKFSAMAAEWWDPAGKFAPLHKFNPVRLAFIRDTAAAHFGRSGLKPFEGLSLLDIGCGGGLLCEPMSRLGFAVTGVDPSEKNIGTAKAHAAGLLSPTAPPARRRWRRRGFPSTSSSTWKWWSMSPTCALISRPARTL